MFTAIPQILEDIARFIRFGRSWLWPRSAQADVRRNELTDWPNGELLAKIRRASRASRLHLASVRLSGRTTRSQHETRELDSALSCEAVAMFPQNCDTKFIGEIHVVRCVAPWQRWGWACRPCACRLQMMLWRDRGFTLFVRFRIDRPLSQSSMRGQLGGNLASRLPGSLFIYARTVHRTISDRSYNRVRVANAPPRRSSRVVNTFRIDPLSE